MNRWAKSRALELLATFVIAALTGIKIDAPPQDISATKKWLSRTSSALDDACSDVASTVRFQRPVYLSFEQSVLYPPLALRDQLDIGRPSDWKDIEATIVFEHLSKYRPQIFGYQFVLSEPGFLTIKKHYQTDLELIEEIASATTNKDIYDLLCRKIPQYGDGNGNSLSPQSVDVEITSFLYATAKKHARLTKLRDYVRDGTIITENTVVSDNILRRACVDFDTFDKLRGQIDAYRSSSSISSSGDSWVRAIEAFSLLTTKNITDLYKDGRYLFLAWPGARGYYAEPQNYHRVITSVFYRLVSIMETPSSMELISGANSHLYDIRDNFQFYLRKVLATEKRNQELSPITLRGVVSLRAEYIKNLAGELKIMEESERTNLIKGFEGKRREVRNALANVLDMTKETSLTLAEIADEFRRDELASGWDILPPEHPIRKLVDNVRPQP